MRRETLRILAALIALLLLAPACALLGVRSQREQTERLGRIRGSVRVEPESDVPIVVVLGRVSEDGVEVDPATGRRAGFVIDHYRLERAGTFAFLASPGAFRLLAFADVDADLDYDVGEPVLVDRPVFELGPGETIDGVELVIPQSSTLSERYDILALQARAPADQENFSLGRFTVKGDVVELDDPKFGARSGSLGMWRFADFLFEIGPGIYFLEEYDPDKVPVLFVHGISGYPQEFSTLIANLDRARFQPWFYFYPSGFHLDRIALHLSTTLDELRARHDFEELAVVAHSMGGLVSRAFILDAFERTGRKDVRLFVAISSPWGGSEMAGRVRNAPSDVVVYSWLDMDPASDFLKGLFYAPPAHRDPRRLPDHVAFHMLFGYKRNEGSLGPSGDGTLTLKSEARLEAVEAAKSILPLDFDHHDILQSREAVVRVNALLAKRFGGGS